LKHDPQLTLNPERMMSKISWKKNGNPAPILELVQRERAHDPSGAISYVGGDVHEHMTTLETLLNFPSSHDIVPRNYVIWRALSSCTTALSPDSFLTALNDEYKKAASTREHQFDVLTTLSMSVDSVVPTTFNSQVHWHHVGARFPATYKQRAQAIEKSSLQFVESNATYACIILRVTAKSEHQAAKFAFDEIDLNRAIWNLLGNFSMETSFTHVLRPINRVRIGRFHTVHSVTSSGAAPSVWTEPNFVDNTVYKPESPDVFQEKGRLLVTRITQASYDEVLKKALLLYVRALDEQDPANALFKLWGALEHLASPPGVADYERVVSRTSFLFEERELHRQVLNHLRERRNSFVHSGHEGSQTRICCYQLQNYFRTLFYFHTSKSKLFNTIEQANEFLDLPTDPWELERRRKVLVQAKKFVSPQTKKSS
jgi:hypothetical protein